MIPYKNILIFLLFLFFISLVSAVGTSPTSSNDMVLYMRLSNNSALGENNTYAVDERNYSYANLTETIYNTSDGFFYNTSLQFNGINSTSKVNYTNLNNSRGYTISFWIYTIKNNNRQRPVFLPNILSFWFGDSNGSTITWYVGNGTGYSIGAGVSSIIYNEWQLYTVTWNSSTSNAILYKNGIPIQAQPYVSNSMIYSSNPNYTSVCFGSSMATNGTCMSNYYNGMIQDVIIYNRTLSSNEILDTYYRYHCPIYTIEDLNLLIHYDFEANDTFRNVFCDDSGYNNSATKYGLVGTNIGLNNISLQMNGTYHYDWDIHS
jgi:hypothetical protein